jgi:hypothetical protein
MFRGSLMCWLVVVDDWALDRLPYGRGSVTIVDGSGWVVSS